MKEVKIIKLYREYSENIMIYRLEIDRKAYFYRIFRAPNILITQLNLSCGKLIGYLPFVLEMNEDCPTETIDKFNKYLMLK